ncbi:MAG: 50S ribosomal protein L32 [Patescibacteria group bacterium]
MRINRSATRKRRSHHALIGARFSKCADCGAVHIPHRVCTSCGKYNGRVVIDMVKAVSKKASKAKEKAEVGSPA